MHLYIAGDSMMGLPGMALTNLSIKTKLMKPMLDYHISTGLVRPDFFNWPAQLQAKVKTFDPGAVAVMFGANDNQAVQTPSGKIYQFGSDGWKKEYRKRVQDAIGLMFQGGVRRVYWIGQPVMPESSYNNQVRLMNEIYQGVAEKTFGVHYIDAYKLLTNGSGQYSQYLPDERGEMQQMREQDGEHLTYAGACAWPRRCSTSSRRSGSPRRGTARRRRRTSRSRRPRDGRGLTAPTGCRRAEPKPGSGSTPVRPAERPGRVAPPLREWPQQVLRGPRALV